MSRRNKLLLWFLGVFRPRIRLAVGSMKQTSPKMRPLGLTKKNLCKTLNQAVSQYWTLKIDWKHLKTKYHHEGYFFFPLLACRRKCGRMEPQSHTRWNLRGGWRLMMCVHTREHARARRRCSDRSHNIRPPRPPISPRAPATGIDCHAAVRTFNIHYQRDQEPPTPCLCLLKKRPFRSAFSQFKWQLWGETKKGAGVWGLAGLCHIREVNSHYRKTRRNKRKRLKSLNATGVQRGTVVCGSQHVDEEKTTADGFMAGKMEIVTSENMSSLLFGRYRLCYCPPTIESLVSNFW